jgi:hypothetical protein
MYHPPAGNGIRLDTFIYSGYKVLIITIIYLQNLLLQEEQEIMQLKEH